MYLCLNLWTNLLNHTSVRRHIHYSKNLTIKYLSFTETKLTNLFLAKDEQMWSNLVFSFYFSLSINLF